jgi:protein-disulfide isomerase
MPSAKAAFCAGQQDPRLFWELHHWLFANQDAWSGAPDAADQFRKQALALGADGAKYDACLADPLTESRILKDMQDGAEAGVSGTPAFFINDWFISGAYPFEEFKDRIEKAKSGVHPPPTPTPLPQGAQGYDADPTRPGFTYDGSPTLGSPDAPLVLISFEDFKCGYCVKHALETEPALKARYVDSGQVRLVFKFFPIYAPGSAVAALCAADQGKFWEFAGQLFKDQQGWQDGDNAKMSAYAQTLGLDVPRFEQCLKDQPGKGQVDADFALGREAGINGTPTFFLVDTRTAGGTRIPGALPLAEFEKAIEQMLNPPTPGPAATP